ncbi:helicase RepA family protein [bacterium]|nr:helicase RepA family protein [bacterium]
MNSSEFTSTQDANTIPHSGDVASNWIVEGILPKGVFGRIHIQNPDSENVEFHHLPLQIAHSVATGTPMFNTLAVNSGDVLYLTAEQWPVHIDEALELWGLYDDAGRNCEDRLDYDIIYLDRVVRGLEKGIYDPAVFDGYHLVVVDLTPCESKDYFRSWYTAEYLRNLQQYAADSDTTILFVSDTRNIGNFEPGVSAGIFDITWFMADRGKTNFPNENVARLKVQHQKETITAVDLVQMRDKDWQFIDFSADSRVVVDRGTVEEFARSMKRFITPLQLAVMMEANDQWTTVRQCMEELSDEGVLFKRGTNQFIDADYFQSKAPAVSPWQRWAS